MERGYRKYAVVMVLCFLLGGFSLMLYFLQIYDIFWQTDMITSIRVQDENFQIPIFSRELRNSIIENNTSMPPMPERRFTISNPSVLLFSPFSIILLFIGAVSLLAGLSIWSLIREREIKTTKKAMLDIFLLPEEKKVLSEIEKYGGSLTQSEIVKNTGFSRVKVHRIIRGLEKKNIVIKNQYGMTNKIVIKK
jgi:uncharacterized membrane protein